MSSRSLTFPSRPADRARLLAGLMLLAAALAPAQAFGSGRQYARQQDWPQQGGSAQTEPKHGLRARDPGSQNQPKPDQDQANFAAVDACLRQEMGNKSIPGASMAIAMQGELAHTYAFGLRRAGAPERVDTETIFRINSTTKMMAAAAVMREVEAGRLDLHAPITRYVPELRLKAPWDASSLSLHNLLANAGGLPDPYLDFGAMPQRYDMPEADVDLTAWARGFANMHLYAPPGSFWNYSSPNFSLAGLAVERSSGQRFEDYVTEHLFRPAGMAVSGFDPEAVVASGNYAVGHVNGQFWGEPGYMQRIHAAPGGGAYSTPSELIAWASQLLDEGGEILSSDAVQAMTRPYFEAEDVPWAQRSSYGYGIFIDDYRPVDQIGQRVRVLRHPGNGRGYGTELVWVP